MDQFGLGEMSGGSSASATGSSCGERHVDLHDDQADRGDRNTRSSRSAGKCASPDDRRMTMARVLGGIGASHAPSMEHVYDAGRGRERRVAPTVRAFDEVRKWLEGIRPDVPVRDLQRPLRPLLVGRVATVRDRSGGGVPDRGRGPGRTRVPADQGSPDLSWHILRSLVADEFDITVCQEMELDHGVISPLPMIDFSGGAAGSCRSSRSRPT